MLSVLYFSIPCSYEICYIEKAQIVAYFQLAISVVHQWSMQTGFPRRSVFLPSIILSIKHRCKPNIICASFLHRHVFHKSCVDPWLLDQRSCPMCKMDILRAYGMQVGAAQSGQWPEWMRTTAVTLRTVVQKCCSTC